MAIMVSENDPEKIISSASGNVSDNNPTALIVFRSSHDSLDWREICLITVGPTAREWSHLEFKGEELFLMEYWIRDFEKHLMSKVTHRGCSN